MFWLHRMQNSKANLPPPTFLFLPLPAIEEKGIRGLWIEEKSHCLGEERNLQVGLSVAFHYVLKTKMIQQHSSNYTIQLCNINLKVIHRRTAFRFISLDISTSQPYLWSSQEIQLRLKTPRLGTYTFDIRDAFLNRQIPRFICEKQLN